MSRCSVWGSVASGRLAPATARAAGAPVPGAGMAARGRAALGRAVPGRTGVGASVGGSRARNSIPVAFALAAVLALGNAQADTQDAGWAARATTARIAPQAGDAEADPPLWLFGEVHDNAGQHRVRLRAFEAVLASGARPALLMEQFDRERQAALDGARTSGNADALIAAAAAPDAGWHWPYYRPYIDLALQHGLPIVAANVSRADARRVMREGLDALQFDDEVPPDIAQAQAEAVVAAHCGMVDPALGSRMAQAQVARDQYMARMVERHAPRGVVLLAGNFHVRRDIGVPRWLPDSLRERVTTVGLLEEGDDSPQAYDRALTTPRQPREDPCASMRLPARSGETT